MGQAVFTAVKRRAVFTTARPAVGCRRRRTAPTPSSTDTWVTIDENPQGINDVGFAVACQNASVANLCYLVDYPASYHNGRAGLSFADGHAEIHGFKSAVITKASALAGGSALPQVTGTGANGLVTDLSWLAENTTGLK